MIESPPSQADLLRLRPQPARVGGPLQQEGRQVAERGPQVRRGIENDSKGDNLKRFRF